MDMMQPNRSVEQRMAEIREKKKPEAAFNGVMVNPVPEEVLEQKRKAVEEMTEEKKKNIFEFDNGDYVDYDAPIDTTFADDEEPDEEGYRTITWTQLKRSFCYERPASKFKLLGDISQKPMEHWERSKQIKIRDTEGCEGAIFFYDDNYDYSDIDVGNRITVRSPRLHKFMDGQEGMRLENAKSISKVVKERFSDAKRLDYGELNKNNGNRAFEKGRYEDACAAYDAAIRHLEGTFHEEPENEQKAKELVVACYLNIAACHVADRKWKLVEIPCNKALQINATAKQNAKAYFRIGQAALKMQEYSIAREALKKANKLLPEDTRIVEEMNTLNQAIVDQKEAEKSLFKKEREANKKEFGLKRRLLTAVPTELDGVGNFREIGGLPVNKDERLRRHVLYRSSNMTLCTKGDLKNLTDDFGIKTIIDLRNWNETRGAQAIAKKVFTGDKANDGADFTTQFTSIWASCKTGRDTKLSVPSIKGKTREEVLEKRVVFNVDMVTKSVMALTTWWVWFVVMLLGALLQIKAASKYIIKNTAARVGPLGLYKQILVSQKAELKFVFDTLCDQANYPVIVTCSAGKDRTGVVVAIMLALIGVSPEHIAADYARSTGKIHQRVLKAQQQIGMGKEWEVCEAQTMHDFINHVKDTYGSVEGYLIKELGVTLEQIQSIRSYLIVSSKE